MSCSHDTVTFSFTEYIDFCHRTLGHLDMYQWILIQLAASHGSLEDGLDLLELLDHCSWSIALSVRPYSLDDLVRELNAVYDYDWKTHFLERVTSIKSTAPLAGIENGGWHFKYGHSVSSYQRAWEENEEEFHYRSSLGLDLEREGKVKAIVPDKLVKSAQ